MTAGLDSGPVWATEAVPVGDDLSAGALTAQLATIGARLLLETLPAIVNGVEPRPQDESAVTLAPKVGRQVARIDWTRPAGAIARHIRAFDPAPGAWTLLGGSEVKLFGAVAGEGTAGRAAPGTVLAVDDTLRIATGDGVVAVREVHPAGKRRQPVAEWARGRGIEPGERFE